MPRLVSRLVPSYALENVVMEAAGPELGSMPPQADLSEVPPTCPPACLPCPAWEVWPAAGSLCSD